MARLGASLNLLDPVRRASVVPQDVAAKLKSGPLKDVISKEIASTALSDVNKNKDFEKLIQKRSEDEKKAAEAQYQAALGNFADALDRLQDGELFAAMKYEIELYRRLKIDRMLWFWLTQIRARRTKPKSLRALRRWQNWITVLMDPRFHKYSNPTYYHRRMAKLARLGELPEPARAPERGGWQLNGTAPAPAGESAAVPPAASKGGAVPGIRPPAPASAPALGGQTARNRGAPLRLEESRLDGWRPAFYTAPGERLQRSALDELTMGSILLTNRPAERVRVRHMSVGPADGPRRAPPRAEPAAEAPPEPAAAASGASSPRGHEHGAGDRTERRQSSGSEARTSASSGSGRSGRGPLPGFLRPTAAYVVRHPAVVASYPDGEIGAIGPPPARPARPADRPQRTSSSGSSGRRSRPPPPGGPSPSAPSSAASSAACTATCGSSATASPGPPARRCSPASRRSSRARPSPPWPPPGPPRGPPPAPPPAAAPWASWSTGAASAGAASSRGGPRTRAWACRRTPAPSPSPSSAPSGSTPSRPPARGGPRARAPSPAPTTPSPPPGAPPPSRGRGPRGTRRTPRLSSTGSPPGPPRPRRLIYCPLAVAGPGHTCTYVY